MHPLPGDWYFYTSTAIRTTYWNWAFRAQIQSLANRLLHLQHRSSQPRPKGLIKQKMLLTFMCIQTLSTDLWWVEFMKCEKLCFSCFRHHKISVCTSKYHCCKCNRKHHMSICNNQPDGEGEKKIRVLTAPLPSQSLLPRHFEHLKLLCACWRLQLLPSLIHTQDLKPAYFLMKDHNTHSWPKMLLMHYHLSHTTMRMSVSHHLDLNTHYWDII